MQSFKDGFAQGYRDAKGGLDDEPVKPHGTHDLSSLDSADVRAIKLAAIKADREGQEAGRAAQHRGEMFTYGAPRAFENWLAKHKP
jgi:hypothetical protein